MKQTYLPFEIAATLKVTERSVLKNLPAIKEITVVRFGKFIRIDKESFDLWFNGEKAYNAENETYTPQEIADILRMNVRCVYNLLKTTDAFRVLHLGRTIRIHKPSFDLWLS